MTWPSMTASPSLLDQRSKRGPIKITLRQQGCNVAANLSLVPLRAIVLPDQDANLLLQILY